MPRALALVALLGVVAVASADLDISSTPASAGYGLTDPTFDFKPTEGTHADIYIFFTPASASYGLTNPELAFKPWGGIYALKGGKTPPVPTEAPLGMVDETCYLWVHFDPFWPFKIQGLHLYPKGAPVGDNAYYTLPHQPGWYGPRWDAGDPPTFKGNPQTMVAVTSWGLQNRPSADPLWNFDEHTALLGAFRFSGVGTAIPELGSLGVSCKGGPPPRLHFTGIQVIPEPASLLMLGLAGLLVRRR